MTRLGMVVEFSRVSLDQGQVVALFMAQNPQCENERYEEYPVEEGIIRQRLLGPEFGQRFSKPMFRFDDCDVSEHDMIHALRACRDLRQQKRITDQRAYPHP